MIPYYIIQRSRNIGNFEDIDYLMGYNERYSCISFSMFKSDALAFSNIDEALKHRNNLQSMYIKDNDNIIHKFKIITL